jgi:hypothetical protein
LPGVLPYNQAKLFIQKFKLKKKKDWELYAVSGKRPSFIPADPDIIYAGKGWKDWEGWLG